MYFSLCIELRKTKRVKRILENRGCTDSKLIPIVLTNKIYSELEFTMITNYFYDRFEQINVPIDKDIARTKANFLKKNLKLPLGLKPPDIKNFLNHKTTFKTLQKDDFLLAGVSMERFILNGTKKYNLLNNIPLQNRKVYAFQLTENIKSNKSFLKHNPNIDIKKPAYYVGQTSKEREERYQEHLSGVRSNRYMKNFAITPFAVANKTQELSELFGVLTEKLRTYQALYYEQKLTKLLQEKGYGAYSK